MTKFWRMYIKFRYVFIPDGPDGDAARGELYRPFMKACGINFKVYSQVFIYNPNILSVGDHVCLGFNSYIGSGADVILEDEVTLGPFAVISSSSRLKKDGSYRFGGLEKKEVRIGYGTQIASHAIVTSGVTIGKGCVVAAGSVVTKSFLEDNLIIGGVPAKVLKVLNS